MRTGLSFAAAAAVAAVVTLTAGAVRADAACQVQWEPDPFGDSGGSLGLICGGPTAPTGNVDGSADKKKGKKKKPPPSHAAIAVNLTTLNDGDFSFVGAYSAGFDRKRKAVRAAERACRRDQPGDCESMVTARNGWAVLVATLTPDQRLVVFGGSDKSYESAFREAEERARDAFGGIAPYEIQRVRGVRSRAR